VIRTTSAKFKYIFQFLTPDLSICYVTFIGSDEQYKSQVVFSLGTSNVKGEIEFKNFPNYELLGA